MSNDKDPRAEGDQAFERRAREQLRRGASEIAPEVRARLDDMANRAAREARVARVPSRRWALTLGAAMALAAAIFLWNPRKPAQPEAAPADDLALLLNVEDFDLLEQMEFYQWLERAPDTIKGEDSSEDPQRS